MEEDHEEIVLLRLWGKGIEGEANGLHARVTLEQNGALYLKVKGREE